MLESYDQDSYIKTLRLVAIYIQFLIDNKGNTMKNEIKPWEIQPDESALAFQAFAMYRDLRPEDRSYVKVAQLLLKHPSQISEWGSKFHWQERIIAYDRELDRIKVKKHFEDIEKMNDRQASQAQAVSRVIFVPVEALLKKMNSPDWPKTLEELQNQPTMVLIEMAKSIASVMPTIMRMERLARGEPTEESRISGQVESRNIERKEYQVDITQRIEQYAESIRDALKYCKPESDA